MTLERTRGIQQRLRGLREGEGFIQTQSGDSRCGTGAEARAHGNIAVDLDLERWEAVVALTSEKPERALNVVLALEFLIDEVEIELALAFHNSYAKAKVKLDGHGERVKARPQVGNRGGNAEFENLA